MFLSIALGIGVILSALDSEGVNVPPSSGDVPVVDFEGLQDYLDQFEDRTVVLNFWATWCVPCVKELPYFEQATAEYDESDVVVVLVSLDFVKQKNKRLIPFIEEHDIQSRVVLLNAPDANAWIDLVSPEWSGAIPATLIKRGDKQAFYEKTFESFEELNQIIQPFLNS